MGKMNRVVFTEEAMRRLEANPHVHQVSETNISYNSAFKLEAIQAYLEGKTPMEIFLSAGFDIDLIGHKKPKHSLKHFTN
jgi:transposase